MKNKTKEILIAMAGGTVFAVAVAWIASPVGLVTGGVSGIGILVKELTNIPIFVTGLVLNVPLFIICTLQRGVGFITKSAIAFLTLTVALSIFESIPSPIDLEGDLLLSAGAYALLSGLGLGLVLRAGATSGGTDMFAAIVKYRRPNFSISSLIVITDAVIVLSGVAVFGVRLSLYAVASLLLSARIIDLVLSGADGAKSVFIISDHSPAIADRIASELQRGVTGIDAEGMYTHSKRQMLFTVVSSRELTELRKIVSETDGKAFVTISRASRVLGEGFDEVLPSSDSFS